jgi:hypothetical protein
MKKENLINTIGCIFFSISGIFISIFSMYFCWFNIYICEQSKGLFFCISSLGDFDKWLVSLVPAIFSGVIIGMIIIRIKLLIRNWK